MDYETIVYEADVVGRIVFNRPETLNAQSQLFLRELNGAFHAASRDPAVRVTYAEDHRAECAAAHRLNRGPQPRSSYQPELKPSGGHIRKRQLESGR